MAEKTRKKVSARTLANRYERIGQRTERLDRLCEIVPGAPDPLEANSREELISRSEWAALDTRRRNRAVGFLRRSNLLGRFMLRPPATYLPSPRDEPFGKNHLKALKLPKVPFRYKDIPMSALAPKGFLTGAEWDWAAGTRFVKAWQTGGSYPNTLRGGFKQDMVALSPFGRAVPEDVRAKVLKARQGFVDDSLKLYRGPLRDNEGTVILKDGEVIANDDNKFKLGVNFIVEGGVGKTGLKN